MTALVVACEEFDDGVSEVELSDVVTDWRCPTVTFDSMTAMVLDGSEVIAVGQVIAGRAEVDVLPSHRGRGVGSALLPFTWDVARRDGRITVGQTVSDGRTDAAPLFLGHGYIRRWTSWVFDIDVGDAAPPRLPDGYRLGELPPGDRAREVCHLIDTAFGEWPDWEGQDFDDWAAQTLEHERFVAAPSPIIVHEGRLVGVAINFDYRTEGWVHQLAVARARRGVGLGRALLSASCQGRPGHTKVALSTDSRTGARTLYENFAMHVRRSYTHWSKHLDAR